MAPSSLEHEIFAAERRRRMYTGITVVLLVAVLVAGYGEANGMNSGGFLTGLPQFFDYPSEIVIEAWEAGPAFWPLMLSYLPDLVETLNIALTATLLGGALATVFAFLSTTALGVPGWIVTAVRRTMDVMRAFPELVIALFLLFIFSRSPVPAMIAVAFHTAGALGKLFSEVVDNIDLRPVEGLRATGAGWVQRIRYAVLPQVAPNFLSYFLLRLEINVRASAILGFVGAGGIGAALRETIGWGQGRGDDTAALFLLLVLTIVVIDQISSAARARLTAGTP